MTSAVKKNGNKMLAKIRQELVNHWDVYLSLTAASIVSALGFTGVAEEKHIFSATLLVLGVLAFSGLRTRKVLSVNSELAESGIQGVLKVFSQERWNEKCLKVEKEIRILHTWIPGGPLPDGLIKAIKLDKKVRILIIDPLCNFAMQRERDIGFPRSSISIMLDALVRLCLYIKEENLLSHRNFEIKLYTALPPFCLYSVDDWILLGFFWHGIETINSPHIEIRGSNTVLRAYVDNTFTRLWESAEPIDHDALMEEYYPEKS